MSQQPLRVLLADDDESLREPLAKYLRQTYGYQVHTAADAQEALTWLEEMQGDHDVALIDDLLVPEPGREPEPLGVALTKEIKARYPNIEIIIFTGWGMESALEALRAGAYRYLAKPLNFEELEMLIQTAAEHSRLKGIAREKQILERLMETSTALLSGHNLQAVLDTILHGVQAIGFDRVRLYLLSADGQAMVGQAQVGMEEAFVGLELLVTDDVYVQVLLDDPRPRVFLRDVDQPPPYEQQLAKEEVTQWACVPLLQRGEVIGKLSMDNKFSRRPIVEAELGPVALFASQAAAAIEKTRLHEEVAKERDRSRWRAMQLLALHKITKEIQSELDLPSLLNLISRLAAELLEADAGGILLLDDQKSHLTFAGSYGLSEQIVEGTRDVVGGSIAGRVVETGKAIIANNIPKDPRFYNPAADGEGLLAIMSTVLRVRGEIIGTLDVHSKSERYAFDEDDLRILSLLATQAATAIQNAKLFEQTSHRALALEALHRTSLEITSYRQVPKLINSILKRAAELLRARGGGLYELNETEEWFKLVGASRELEHLVGGTLDTGNGVIGRVLKTKAPIAVSDYRNWSHRLGQYDSYNFTAVVGAPIIWQGRIWGAIAIHDDVEGRIFSQEEINLLSHFGNLAAVALENAELVARDMDKLRRLEKLAQANSVIMGNLATMSLDERLNLIAKYAAEILDAETCGIFMVKRAGFLSLEAGYGHREGGFQKGKEFVIRTGPRTGLTGHIAYEGKLFNAYGDDLIGHFAVIGEESHAASGRCYSLLAIPLTKKGGSEKKLIGLLRVDNKKDRKGQAGPTVGFSREDEWILSLFADAVVVAIEGAELVVELNEQKDHWARLFSHSPNGIIAIDRQGNITGFSDQAQKILKYRPEEVFGKPVDFLYDDPQEPRRVGRLLYAAPDGKLANHETVVRSKEDERIPIRLASTWLYDARGTQIGSVGYFEDLRSIKEAERRLALLFKASNIVAQAENLTDGLQSLAEMMVTFLDVSFCRSFLLDENQYSLVAKAVYPEPIPSDRLDWNPGPEEEQIDVAQWSHLVDVLEEGTPKVLRIEREQHRPFLVERSSRLGLKQSVRSLLLIPLKARDKIVGLLALAELRPWERAPISEQKQELAVAIADQIAILIDRMYLHEVTDRHRQLLSALDRASRNIRAEKETFKLLQEVVRLAAELVGCTDGGLYVNRPHLKELELLVTYELPSALIGNYLPQAEGVVGLVARTGRCQIVRNYPDWTDRENIFEAYDFKTVVGVPLKQAGEVDAVLFVADRTGLGRFAPADLDILERFAAQASIALRTSQLMNQEQRMFGQLDILHKISDYIQAARDLDKILHAVLTGVTAGYGLSFNRAALLLLDERRENLVGRMGLGHLDEVEAMKARAWDHQEGLFDFGQYLKALERDDLPLTPIDEQIRGLRLPIRSAEPDVFSQVVLAGECILVTGDKLDNLPDSFIEAFEPDLPLIVAPLLARDQVIGLLVADNKFTRSPVTPEDIESLLTFAATAAVVIDNTQLFHQTKVAQERLSSFFEASNALVSFQDPGQILQDIVKRARVAADASGVRMVLLDEMGETRNLITTGADKQLDVREAVRPNGLSMQVMGTGKPEVVMDAGKERDRVNPTLFDRGIAAAVGLPVSLEGKRIGVMWLHYNQPRHFSEAEIKALQLYVNQAAIAYDSARRIRELEYLHRAAEALAGVAGLQEVLKQIVQSACEVLYADSAAIWSYDAVRDRFTLERLVVAGIPAEWWEEFKKVGPRPDGTAYTVMERGWLGVTDVDNLQQYGFLGEGTREFLGQIEALSFQGIALTVGDETLGILYVNYHRPRSFSEEEQKIAQTFANHAVLALKKAKLLDQVRRARNAARIVAEATVLENLQSTLGSIVKGMRDVLGCDVVTLRTYDSEHEKFGFPPATEGVKYPEKILEPDRVTEQSVVYNILVLDTPYVAEDTMADSLMRRLPFVEREGIVSSVGIPLVARDRKVGVMFVGYRNQHRFTDDELTNIELFANQAAVAIRNAQLYEQVQRRVGALYTLYEAGRAVTSSLQLDEILSPIAEHACKLVGSGGKKGWFSHVALIDGTMLRFKVAYPAEHLPGKKEGVDNIDLESDDPIGITGRAVKTGQTQLVGDINGNADYIKYDPNTRSELAVPIKLGPEVIGVINVEAPDYNTFDKEDQQALQTLAAQAGVAIQKARLFEEIQRHARLLDAAAKVAHGATSILDEVQLLNEVVQLVVNCFDFCYHAGVFLLDDKREYAVLRAASSEGGQQMLEREHKLKVGQEGIVGFVTQKGRPRLTYNVEKDPHHFPNPDLPLTRAEMAFPLIARDQVIGALDVQSTEVVNLRDEDVATLQTMADQLANAIDNARLYQQVARRLKEANALQQAAVALTGASELNEVLTLIMTEAMKLTSAIESSVLFWDAQAGKFTKALKIEKYRKVLEEYSTRARGQGARARQIIDELRPIAIADAHQLTDFNPIFIEKGHRASLGVPLLSQGGAIGVLYVRDNVPRQFSERQVALLEALASQAAVAIDRASQYDELKRTKGLVGARTAVAWMGMVSATWRHAIEGHAMTIQEEVEHLCADSPQEYLDGVDKRLVKIKRLARLILEKPITPPLSEEEGVETVPINELLRERLRQLWENEPYRTVQQHLDLKLNDAATVRASPEWLRRIFDVLVDNAVEAMASVSTPELTVSTRVVGSNVEIVFADTGQGIPEEILPILFHEQIEQANGLGIGLLMAQTIAQTYGGEIRVESTHHAGTSMVVSLPIGIQNVVEA